MIPSSLFVSAGFSPVHTLSESFRDRSRGALIDVRVTTSGVRFFAFPPTIPLGDCGPMTHSRKNLSPSRLVFLPTSFLYLLVTGVRRVCRERRRLNPGGGPERRAIFMD